MEHNSYEDGNVQSIKFKCSEGKQYSVGVVAPGYYEFTSACDEVIHCLSGRLIINGLNCNPGHEVTIESGQKFTIQADIYSSYKCSYLYNKN